MKSWCMAWRKANKSSSSSSLTEHSKSTPVLSSPSCIKLSLSFLPWPTTTYLSQASWYPILINGSTAHPYTVSMAISSSSWMSHATSWSFVWVQGVNIKQRRTSWALNNVRNAIRWNNMGLIIAVCVINVYLWWTITVCIQISALVFVIDKFLWLYFYMVVLELGGIIIQLYIQILNNGACQNPPELPQTSLI